MCPRQRFVVVVITPRTRTSLFRKGLVVFVGPGDRHIASKLKAPVSGSYSSALASVSCGRWPARPVTQPVLVSSVTAPSRLEGTPHKGHTIQRLGIFAYRRAFADLLKIRAPDLVTSSKANAYRFDFLTECDH